MRLCGLIVLGLFLGLLFKPHSAYAWWNSDWSARKTITIDTGATGGGVSDPIGDTPVLIRLDVGNFTFDNAKPDGSDLRFVAADDKTPLAYHIEKYDNLLGQAFVWVGVPDLEPGAQTRIFVYYGNPKATAGDNAKATYDASTVAVYHFGEHHGAPAKDWTGNGNTTKTAAQPDDYALIGPGGRLDGQAPVTLPATPGLAWAGGNTLTWSIWVNETALQPDAVLYSRTDDTSTVQIGIDNGVPFVTVTTAAGTERTSAGAAITAASWHHIAVTAGAQIALYVDGAPYATLKVQLPALNTVSYLGGDATTDTAAAAASATPNAGPPAPGTPPAATPSPAPTATTTGFIGEIDELEISNVARPVGYIKFAAIEQGTNPLATKLVTYGVESKPASFFSGPFVVILSSVTVDGWVVIGILALMAVVSWVVMVDKVSYVNRITQANTAFIGGFAKVGYDLTALDTPNASELAATPAERKAMNRSPLYHIYHIGADEIRTRFSQREVAHGKVLSAQSIAAIRSALDSGLTRETQRMNKSMVLLTIAIAGGPFLGLLGTVVGVMITFATIAASGDVNVAAIAPGISAALVATVAGLVVAIPALFGYNYLNSRIGDGVTQMQIFVDEYVAKLAEYYSPPLVDLPRAAE